MGASLILPRHLTPVLCIASLGSRQPFPEPRAFEWKQESRTSPALFKRKPHWTMWTKTQGGWDSEDWAREVTGL